MFSSMADALQGWFCLGELESPIKPQTQSYRDICASPKGKALCTVTTPVGAMTNAPLGIPEHISPNPSVTSSPEAGNLERSQRASKSFDKRIKKTPK